MPDLPTDDEPMRSPLDLLFAQPFAAYIVRSTGTVLDLSFLSDTEYESLMKWLYAQGWGLLTETRTSITVDPTADLPPRIWIPATIGAATTASTTVRTRRRPATIPRFCRHGPNCSDKDVCCYYTHEDTIHCIDEVCAFDGNCCGEKRRTCIRIHPSEGQFWTPELVVSRS
jgi:hypothetical protein